MSDIKMDGVVISTEEVSCYRDFLKGEKKVTLNTLDSYGRDVQKYLEYAVKNGYKSLLEADGTALASYLAMLQENGMSASTLSRNLASIRSFYRFLQKTKRLTENPTNEVGTFKVEKKVPQVLTEKEVETLLSCIKRVSLKGIRDYAMFKLLYGTGLRVSELINLVVSDINYAKKVLLCRRNTFERNIPLTEDVLLAVQEYMEKSRPMLVRDEDVPHIFVNCNGNRLTRQGFWKIIKTYKEISLIEKEITPHTLRHSFAYHLLQKGVDIKTIQHMLGHIDISSTNMYVQMLKLGMNSTDESQAN